MAKRAMLEHADEDLCRLVQKQNTIDHPPDSSLTESQPPTRSLRATVAPPERAQADDTENPFQATPGWPAGILLRRVLWIPFQLLFVRGTTRFLSPLRVLALRLFGARIGARVLVCAGVKVWYPWNLTMGSRCTIGAEVEVYNFAPVVLEDDATVSQYTYICTASHDYTGPAMKLTFRPISIGPKAWVAAGSFIGPGVVIGEGAVVGARSVVTRDVRPWMIVAGNPAREIKPRIYSGR